jgi:hypothetical protein
VFSIAMGFDNGFYVNQPDMSLGAMHYINNFTPMFVTKDNKGFGETFKYVA